jgi:hypothetical protein
MIGRLPRSTPVGILEFYLRLKVAFDPACRAGATGLNLSAISMPPTSCRSVF